ncbi:A disintegrin and metalloproteinase with thrombospondin motifs 2-like isoform X3 [Diorhabda sublineata]|uniref:A disintegrin and metalloproteinase with thrombospondin motifs 2-like isoform X3 n=1 Tax=Diorhabda sublineata TaxID=1163346 RepID=UPI0024E0570C|nr:A disintegrin and metalloproteinase with thrombospondin motifs 2-like isoform X3 [Diorhabda sublineata]
MERIRFMCFHLYNQNMFFCVFVASLIVCAFEFCGADLDLTYAEDVHSVFPRMEVKRIKRSLGDGDVKVVKLGDWSLELESQGNLVLAPGLKTEWYKFNNVPILEEPKKCNYHMGVVKGMKGSSKAAVSICNTLFRGYFEVGNVVNFFEPLDEKTGEHVIYKSKTHIHKRSPTTNRWIFNLTGDTIDIDDNLEEYEEEENQQDIETTSENFFEIDNMTIVDVDDSDDGNFSAFPFTHPEGAWHQLGDDGEEDDGYFYDNEWTPSLIQVRKSPSGSILSPRWMEIAVAVDHTLISFHGREMVEEYVLSLLNIVSAIYQDPSLESNMKLVVTKLLMYEHKKYRHRVIKSGNAKKSLENVNSWNKALHASLRPGEPVHDVAIWLTRSDIGGPSGYAPVGGVCDPKRSCALNRDEGLTSAFIIAHETAHILGLSHDGDEKNDNDCSDDILDGSIMAPMVSATFNKFYWSECSRREFKKARSKWLCLLNSPIESLGEIPLNATLQASFTMDQQCRMEFGEGYKMCTAFEIIEPCSHLWCGHEKTPLVCKTKKGPPLEGTECGFGKWCVNGYCEDFAKRVERIPIVLNPQDGQWGDWGPWGPCTKSCDTGVQFRARKCDNPPPSFGGKVCEGDSEEWRLCKITECGSQIYVDLRAQQCKHLPKIFNLVADNITWLPYESDENAKKCKFICLNADKREIYFTDENLVDGSLCSYENNDNICVQGVCHVVGCDGILHSPLRRDRCGVCGGDNSDCIEMKRFDRRRLKKESSRISVFPEQAHELKTEINLTKYHSDNPVMAVILKNRKRKSYSVISPDSVVRNKIFEGARFHYQRVNNRYAIWAKGPIHSEMVVLIVVDKSDLRLGINISYSTEYSIHKDYLLPSSRFVWILGGWGPCSVSCEGGRRQRTAACFDNNNNKIVKRTHCSLFQKPKLDIESCNTFSCSFKWVPGEWEPCTTSCGTLGVQHREIYCLPGSVLESTNSTIKNPWRFMVNPIRCDGDTKPSSLKFCNRKPCLSFWTFGNWTQCSSTCGSGFKTRSSYCFPPPDETFFTCGDSPPPQRQRCLGTNDRFSKQSCKKKNKFTCQQDESEFCKFDLLHKYCQIKGFRRICCKACSNNSTMSI